MFEIKHEMLKNCWENIYKLPPFNNLDVSKRHFDDTIMFK